MAKVNLNNIFIDIQGRIGDYVFKKSPSGKIIISRKPDMSNVKWSKAQKAQRRLMKKANVFAQAAMADPEQRTSYEQRAEELDIYPYNLAISDYFKIHVRKE